MTIFRFDLVTLLTASAAQVAQVDPSTLWRMTEGSEVIEACHTGYGNDERDEVRKALAELKCNLLLKGAVGAHEDLVLLQQAQRQFCLPPTISLKQMAVEVLHHFEGRDVSKATSTSLILIALKRSFPCA
ncbi:MAG: Rap1a/Tai family immunity protein [Novosphingobium sp.]